MPEKVFDTYQVFNKGDKIMSETITQEQYLFR